MPLFNYPAKEIDKGLKPFSIAWLFPHADLAKDPSNRLRRYQISRHLSGMAGLVTRCEDFFFYSEKVNIKEQLSRFDVIVLFSINDFDLNLIKFLNAQGKITIFDHSENIFGLGHEEAIMQEVSAITCCSYNLALRTQHEYLYKILGIDKPVFVIRDPIEDAALQDQYDRPYPRGEDTALIMGMGANVQYVMPTLEKYCAEAGYKIMLLTETGFTYPRHQVEYWTPYTWIDHALKCSVALCFHNIDQFPAKGNVKVTTPMSVGLPVIACPIDSYKEAIDHGYDGFIAYKDSDWVEHLNFLKDKGKRNMMGLRARQSAITKYSTMKIALDYIAMINYLQSLIKGGDHA